MLPDCILNARSAEVAVGAFPDSCVTKDEIQAIARALEITEEEFREKYLRKVHYRSSLNEKPNYDCIFLHRDADQASCLIYTVRPQQCRTWPFWKRNIRTPNTWNQQVDRCPGINRGKMHPPEEIEEITKSSPC